MIRPIRLSATLLFLFVLSLASHASGTSTQSQKGVGPLNARAAVLIDAATGTLLYAKNPNLVLPPASLTKLVTLHLVMEEIRYGRLSESEIIDIDKRDCSPYIPYGSSIMYLQPGMKVSVKDLMLGAAVVSGNDAAFALARRVAGSNEAFAEKMNATMKEMGFRDMHFVEPSGLSEQNLVSAYEFAQFCRIYLLRHPDVIAELHSVPSIAFPRPEHAVPGFTPPGNTIQYNKNTMLFKYDGCDGLKTGYIIEVGYNLAVTARREGTRFIAVTLGGMSTPKASGITHRTADGTALLDWAFANFATVAPDPGPAPVVRTWFGQSKTVTLRASDTLAVTVPEEKRASVKVEVNAPEAIDAPVKAGQKLGEVVYTSGNEVLRRVDLVAENDVTVAGFFQRLKDTFAKFFTGLFRAKNRPATATAKA